MIRLFAVALGLDTAKRPTDRNMDTSARPDFDRIGGVIGALIYLR